MALQRISCAWLIIIIRLLRQTS